MKTLFVSLIATVTLFGSAECWNLKKVDDAHFQQMLKNYTHSIDIKSDFKGPLRVEQRKTAVTLDKCDNLRTIQQAKSMDTKKILALQDLEEHSLNKNERAIKKKAIKTSISAYKGINPSKFFPRSSGQLVYFGGEEFLPGKFFMQAVHLKNGKLNYATQEITQHNLKKLYCTSDIPLQSYLSSIGLEADCETNKKKAKKIVQKSMKQKQKEIQPINEFYMLTNVINLIKVDDLKRKKQVPLNKGQMIRIIEKRDKYITFCLVNDGCTSAKYGMKKSSLNKFQQYNH